MTDIAWPLLTDRIFNRAQLITPEKAEMIAAVLSGRLRISAVRRQTANGELATLDAAGLEALVQGGLQQPPMGRDVAQVIDGVMVIPVRGTLVKRNGLHPYSGMTGYDGLSLKLLAARADPAVRAVLFDIDSCGGASQGLFELTALIRETAAQMPVAAAVNDNCCSAAYAIACQCSPVSVSTLSWTGSIGVVVMHADFSEALKKQGVNVTIINAGARKADGSPFQPLSQELRQEIQADVDQIYGAFVDLVAQGRGLDANAVRATEAGIFRPADAIRLGLADREQSVDAALDALITRISGPGLSGGSAATQPEKEAKMSDTREDVPAPGAMPAPDAAAHERQRIGAILNAPEAQGREALARHLACNTDLTAEAAVAALKAATPEKPGGALASLMATQPNANIGAGDSGGDPRPSLAASMRARFASDGK